MLALYPDTQSGPADSDNPHVLASEHNKSHMNIFWNKVPLNESTKWVPLQHGKHKEWDLLPLIFLKKMSVQYVKDN